MKAIKCLSLICAALVCAGTLPMQAAAAEGATPTGTPLSDVPALIEDYAANNPNDYVSFAASVVTPDSVVYSGAFGYTNREENIKADADTVYEWGSVSKTMIWVSVMQLYEQGKLSLDADISTYLPAGFLHTKYDTPITLLDLMNHAGGWGETSWALQTSDENAIPSLEQALADTEATQIFQPGTISSYSNWGAALAALIVERVSGENYADYVHEHIFTPLGMEHTAIDPARRDNAWVKAQRDKLASYAKNGDDWICTGPQLCYITIYPAGAVTGTIDDMAKYAQSFMQEPCPLFENPDTLDTMLSPSSTLGDTDFPVFCHGLMPTQYGDFFTYGHSGGTNACTSIFQFDPKSKIGVVAMMNGSGPAILKMPELIYGEQTANLPADQPLSITEHKDISGIYYSLRAPWHGPLRFMSLLGMLPVAKTGEDTFNSAGVADSTRISDDLLTIKQGDFTGLGLSKTQPDGTMTLQVDMQSYKTDRGMNCSLIALILFLVFALIGALLLLIKLIQRIAKKRKQYVGAGWMTASQIMRIVLLAAIVFVISVYSNQYGITRMQAYLLCGIAAVCFLVFAVTALTSLCGIFSKKPEKAGIFKYLCNFIANGISAFAVISLELIQFWNI